LVVLVEIDAAWGEEAVDDAMGMQMVKGTGKAKDDDDFTGGIPLWDCSSGL
jgi:hypothetical protein